MEASPALPNTPTTQLNSTTLQNPPTVARKMQNQRVFVLPLLLLLLLPLAHAGLPIPDGPLRNGNFEVQPDPKAMKGTVLTGETALPEWRIRGVVEYIESGHRQRDMLVVVPEGAHAVRLGNEASITQTIPVLRNAFYALVFTAARTCAQEERLNVTVAGVSDVIPIQTVYSSNGWDTYAWAFRAPASASASADGSAAVVVEFTLHNPGTEEDPACGPVLDSVGIRRLFPPGYSRHNGLVKNGNVEEGPLFLPETREGVLLPPLDEDDVPALPGWIVESLKAVKYVDSAHFFVPQGRRAVQLVAGRESALSQIVRTVPGRAYVLSFMVGDARDGCVGLMSVEAFAGNSTRKVVYSSRGAGGFVRAFLAFRALSARTRLTFYSSFYHMKADGSLCGPLLDAVGLH